MNIQEFIQKEIDKYGQDKINEAGIVFLENEREIKTLSDLVDYFCCLTECKNCPVHIHNYDKRSEYEKCTLHHPCIDNLYKWIIEEVKKVDE